LEDPQNGQFTSNTQRNPKEQCKSTTTRSEIVIGEGINDNLIVYEEKKDEQRKIECEEEEKKKN